MNMNKEEVGKSPELQQVLWVCYECWKNETLAPNDRVLCFSWLIDPYRKKFGTRFKPTDLYWLTKYGFLIQGETGKGGNRRYYKLADPDKTFELLQAWALR